MKRMLSVAVVMVLIAGLAGVALAQGPGWGRGMGMGWGGAGQGACPMSGAGPGAPAAPQEQITEDKAKELATEYAAKYFTGYTVERVLPFTGHARTMYQVELKGPKGETRYLHVNPWGGVRPFAAAPLAALDE